MTTPVSKLAGLPLFTDLSGVPLDLGEIFIGQPNTDPRQSPAQVFWDEAQTLPAVQPLTTLAGRVSRAGALAEVFVNPPYSLYVQDKRGQQINYFPNVDDPIVTTIGSLSVAVVANVAALKLVDPTRTTNALVMSYYSAAGVPDGGGGIYRYDSSDTTTPDNGGTVFVDLNNARWKLFNPSGAVSLKQFGAKGDGVTDDYTAIQAAITAGTAASSTFRQINVTPARYQCNHTLNLTNLAATGVPLRIQGAGIQYNDGTPSSASVIQSNPGAGAWIADLCGSEFVTIDGVMFVATGANAATYGLLYARSTTANFAQNNLLTNCIVKIAPASGSVAVANNCAEQFLIDGCWLEADVPFTSTLANEQGYTSTYTTLANTTFSNTVYTVRNTTFNALSSTAMIITGLATAKFEACTWECAAGNVYPYGITVRSSAAGYKDCQNMLIHGQVEGFAHAIRFEGNTESFKVDISTSGVTSSHLYSLAGVVHNNPEFASTALNNTPQTMLQASAASVTLNGGRIKIGNGLTQVDTNTLYKGTDIDGGSADLSNTAVFQAGAGSSYHPRYAKSRFYGSTSWNPGTVSNLTAVATTFAVAGLAVGDKVDVVFPYASQGCTAQASCDSAGVARIVLQNMTGASATFAAGTWKVVCEHPAF